MMKACTIVAQNYLAQARVLARSFLRLHPETPFTILIVDGVEESREEMEGIEILHLKEIELEPGDECRMPMLYDVTELSTAVKPWLLRHLLKGEPDAVIYFDPDIQIFAPVDFLAQLAEKHGIVLTPHVTEPIPRDGLRVCETDILASGIYNLGFIAVGLGSVAFLDWWKVRLKRECIADPPNMRFTDQRWIDFVPALYPHHIVRDPGCNVAYWNLYSRKVVEEGGSYLVNGEPLCFFHFSGYDPDRPHLLSRYQGEKPRTLLSESAEVAALCRSYGEELLAEGFGETKGRPYGFGFLSDGTKIDRYMRQIYRAALKRFEDGEGPEPPNAFPAAQESGFVDWISEPIRKQRPIITRYMLAVRSARTDLQGKFFDVLEHDAAPYHEWFVARAVEEAEAQPRFLPPDAPINLKRATAAGAAAQRRSVLPVNVVGYLHAELGVGEAARRLIAGLEASQTPFNAITNRDTLSRQQHPFDRGRSQQLDADINIICVNADQTPQFAKKVGARFFENRYSIGLWVWEVEEFPAAYGRAFDCVDEIWAQSDFVREILLKVSPKPVNRVHLPILIPPVSDSISRADLGLPDRFTFLFSFDFFSVFERKNPVAVIEAFKAAFAPGAGPVLVIKTINGDKRLPDLEKLRFAASGHPDIIVIDGYISALEKNTMAYLCDCYVSLHRSEGYGLTMTEAMALGKPVIATGYSGNLDFMTPQNSYLCSYSMVPIGPGAAPYPARSRWADPDIDEAANFMRGVYENPAQARAIGARAAEDVRTRHSAAQAGAKMRRRLDQIRRHREIGWSQTSRDEMFSGSSRVETEDFMD